MPESHSTWAEIDLSAIAHNTRALKDHLGPDVILCAVVKANAYGHGAEAVARTVLAHGAGRLAVARVEEGMALREAGIAAPILVLGPLTRAQAPNVVAHGLTPTVNSLAVAQALAHAVHSTGQKVPVHVKVDTGMARYGLLPHEVVAFVRHLAALPGLALEGLWTHFAAADEADKSYTRQQLAIYRQVLENVEATGLQVTVRHAANSAAMLDLPETHLDMVRCGITIYGLYPSRHVSRPVELRPAMTLKARVGRVRQLPAGVSVSYGRTYTTDRETRLVLVSVGYGDGYSRALSNRGHVLVGNLRAPIVGRVCMDLVVVDASGAPNVREGDEVVVFGSGYGGADTAGDLAEMLHTIPYEIVTAIAARVPRVYVGTSLPGVDTVSASGAGGA
jgi:alanine racemase